MNNRIKGADFENKACDFLADKGFALLEKNYRRKTGEIDLIMRDDRTFVFIEVKYRRNLRKGFPEEAVNAAKQKRIFRTAEWYLNEHRLNGCPCRFDVVAICGDEIRHIINAFGGL